MTRLWLAGLLSIFAIAVALEAVAETRKEKGERKGVRTHCFGERKGVRTHCFVFSDGKKRGQDQCREDSV